MHLELTSFRKSENDIRSLRDTVFGLEQGVPREIDWDGKDTCCTHVLAKDSDGIPVGTGRIHSDGKIGRLAVVVAWRRHGVGGAMLEALVNEAYAQRLKRVYLHAQSQAISFYTKHGFHAEGAAFVEADIPHVKMTRELEHVSGSDD